MNLSCIIYKLVTCSNQWDRLRVRSWVPKYVTRYYRTNLDGHRIVEPMTSPSTIFMGGFMSIFWLISYTYWMGFEPTTSPPPFFWEEVSVELELIGCIILYIANSLVPSHDRPVGVSFLVLCLSFVVQCLSFVVLWDHTLRDLSHPQYI